MQFIKVITWVISGKEVVISLDLTIPRGSLLYVDAKLNVTLPSFNPMLLGVKLHEKNPKDYDVSYKDNSSTYLWVTHPHCTLVNICICLIYSLACTEHVFQVTSFSPLARPPSDLCNVKALLKNLKKTIYIFMGQRSCSSYKDIVKHMLKCYVKVDENKNNSVLKTMFLFFLFTIVKFTPITAGKIG